MSFRYKTIIGIAVIEAVMLSLLVWNALYILTSSSERELIKKAKSTTELFAASNKDAVLSTDLATLESFIREVLNHPGIIYARVLGKNGIILAQGGDDNRLAESFNPDLNYSDIEDGVFDAFAVIEEADVEYGRVEIGFSISEIESAIAETRRKSLAFAAIEMLLTAIFSLILGIYLTRAVNHLRKGAKNISEGNFGYQIKVRGRDELAEAAVAFNEMYYQLERLEIEHKRYDEELKLFKFLSNRSERKNIVCK
jgi:methyl-accepting chemotaxis protein